MTGSSVSVEWKVSLVCLGFDCTQVSGFQFLIEVLMHLNINVLSVVEILLNQGFAQVVSDVCSQNEKLIS